MRSFTHASATENRNMIPRSQIFIAMIVSWTILGALIWIDGVFDGNMFASKFEADIFEADFSNAGRRKLLQDNVGAAARVSVWNPIIQPTKILRIALLIIQNAALNNPTAGFLQMVLNTELGLTKFSNVYASLAAGVAQDFSQGISLSDSIGNAWTIDGESVFTSGKASEFVVGGAFGLEQFFGVGFEVTGSAAAAIAQFLAENPNTPLSELVECTTTDSSFFHYNDTFYHKNGTAMDQAVVETLSDFSNCTNTTSFLKSDVPEQTETRRKLLSKEELFSKEHEMLSQSELKKRKLPENVEKILVHERVKMPKFLEKTAAQHVINRHEARQNNDTSEHPSFFADKRRGLQEIVDDTSGRNANVTFDDVEALTTEWFDSFPNALPISIRDNFLALLEETIVDPQIRMEIEIIVALVGVAEPGRGTTAAEVASSIEWTGQVVLHGYDAAMDVASTWETANAVAGSASAGLAIAEAINDATEIIGAVTEIVDTVNAIQSEQERDAVSAQSGGGNASSSINTDKLSQYIKPLPYNETVRSSQDSYSPETASCENDAGLCVNNKKRRLLQEPIDEEIIGGGGINNVLGQFTPTGGEDESFGAISGTYAVTVTLVFLEQVSINGGSITII